MKPTESLASSDVVKDVCMDMDLRDDDTSYSIKRFEKINKFE